MKTILISLIFILFSSGNLFAVTWEDCTKSYEQAKIFSDNTKLKYQFLKSTKSCLKKFKKNLIKNPNNEFSVSAMRENIANIQSYIDEIVPSYIYSNELEEISSKTNNEEYNYMVKFKNCNGVHAGDKIYTAKHCKIDDSKKIVNDLSYLEANKKSNLEVEKLDLEKNGVFKYYSMSKVGKFFEVIIKEENCRFYKEKNIPRNFNVTLDLADLEKEYEIRSNCLAIPSNSGGGVFQDDKLVGIISKTVFNNNEFLYSIIEPVIPQ